MVWILWLSAATVVCLVLWFAWLFASKIERDEERERFEEQSREALAQEYERHGFVNEACWVREGRKW